MSAEELQRRLAEPRDLITGVILAGGRARRMGGEDKGLVDLAGKPMVAHVATLLRAQVNTLFVNANRNLKQYETVCQCRVVNDVVGEFAGPLAGIASGMQAADTPYVLVVPCDSPLITNDLAARLYEALVANGAEISVAHDGARLQPVFALLSCQLLSSVLDYLAGGEHKIDRWYAQHDWVAVDFSPEPDMFANINTPADRSSLEAKLSARGATG
jgi:molybdopterin-guanine dinucleotide biosynthesis protein A